MRNPEQVLNILAEHSSDSSYKYERLYRILFNEQMFYVAYQRIHAKPGNMTAGTDKKTADGMSVDKVNKLIDSLKNETYSPKPAKGGFTYPRRTARNVLWVFPLSQTS